MVFVAVDGTERPFTTAQLEARANQMGRALAARGVGVGDRVGLELRNSPELVSALFGAWKVGAAPVPIRWDLPEWERERVTKVLDGKLVITERDLSIFSEADGYPTDPLPAVVPPVINGICSSGS